MLNIKDNRAFIRLKDSDREPFYSADDQRFDFLTSLASSVEGMHGGKGRSRSKSLTTETRSSFVNTISGIMSLTKHFLTMDHSYV
jgi:hypothetical protein